MQRINKLALNGIHWYSTSVKYSYDTLEVNQPCQHVIHVKLNRPEKRNSVSLQLIDDYKNCFDAINNDSTCRAVVVSGNGKMFSAGIDFESLMAMGQELSDDLDVSRKQKKIQNFVKNTQHIFYASYNCSKPVIAAIHGGCIGAGSSLAAGTDIRLCSSDAWFQVKEVAVGISPDQGILQRLIKNTGNDSLSRELALTARKFDAEEALRLGFISRIFGSTDLLMAEAIAMAKHIAEKGPVPVQTTKQALNYSTNHSIEDGLEYMTWYWFKELYIRWFEYSHNCKNILQTDFALSYGTNKWDSLAKRRYD